MKVLAMLLIFVFAIGLEICGMPWWAAVAFWWLAADNIELYSKIQEL